MRKKRIAVFFSGGGTNFQSLIDGVDSGKINAEIALAVSSNHEAGGIKRAEQHNIPLFIAPIKDYPCGNCRDAAILKELKNRKIEFIFLCGYLGIITPVILSEYPFKIVNIHPSLLPSHAGKGMFGKIVHQEVLRLRESFTGATTHFVDEGTDTGAIIMQKSIPVLPDYSVDILAEKVLKECEHVILPETARLICEDRVKVKKGKVIIK